MKKTIVYNGFLYEAFDEHTMRNIYEHLKNAILELGKAKNGISDKNLLKALKAKQKQIAKMYKEKFKPVQDGTAYVAKSRDEQLEQFRQIDDKLKQDQMAGLTPTATNNISDEKKSGISDFQ